MSSGEVAKGLDDNDGTGDGIHLRNRPLKLELQGLPGTAVWIGKEDPVIGEAPAQDFREAGDGRAGVPGNSFRSPPSKL